MNLDIEKLEALAKACQGTDHLRLVEYHGKWYLRNEAGIVFSVHRNSGFPEYMAENEAYARLAEAANPAAVLELITEIVRLKAVEDYLELELSGVQRAKGDLAEKLGCADEPRWKWLLSGADDLIRERDKLKVENEALRKNATRYEWLRDERTHPGCLSSDPDKARWLNEYLMCGEKLDAAIDEQLAK